MPSVFDTVKGQLGEQPANLLQGVQNIQAANAGKTTTAGAAPAKTTLAADQARGETKAQLQETFQQSEAVKVQQVAQKAATDAQYTEQNQLLSEQRVNMEEGFATQAANILQSFAQQKDTLDLNKNKARVEQLGFFLRLGNSEYTDKLQAEGRRSRLTSDYSFKEALQRSILGDDAALFDDTLAFKRMMSADAREFSRLTAEMDLDTAMRLSEAAVKQYNTEGVVSGLSSITSGGIKAVENENEKKNSAAVPVKQN